MALYDSVRDLPLSIERYELEGHEYAVAGRAGLVVRDQPLLADQAIDQR